MVRGYAPHQPVQVNVSAVLRSASMPQPRLPIVCSLPAHVETRVTSSIATDCSICRLRRVSNSLWACNLDCAAAVDEPHVAFQNTLSTRLKQMWCRPSRDGTQHAVLDRTYMDADRLDDRTISLSDAENWLALGGGALLLLVGASRRSAVGALLAVSSAPLLYRGITGHWPASLNGSPRRTTPGAPSAESAACTCANRFGSKCRSPTSTGSGVALRTCRDS